ncbi:MAG TPA: DNA replication and repair protein RecF [Chthoniobacterales bacterium]
MLSWLELRQFRCFERARVEFAPGRNCIVGPNARGKTSLLEAACVLLRLLSPRATTLGQAIRFGQKSFALEGQWNASHCQYVYSAMRRKLVLDAVEQRRANEYLQVARVVWFGNDDLDLIRGGSDLRRRFLDFAIAQVRPVYRVHLRAYEKALRSRNALLKQGGRPREVAAYNGPLINAGVELRKARMALIDRLAGPAETANQGVSGTEQGLKLAYRDGAGEDFAVALAESAHEENRLRQTVVGPHRDDLLLSLDGKAVATFGSEGQQRTAALALKLGQAELLAENQDEPPLLLIDDIFGELDVGRRNRLLGLLPPGGQQIITTTHLDWMEGIEARILEIEQL